MLEDRASGTRRRRGATSSPAARSRRRRWRPGSMSSRRRSAICATSRIRGARDAGGGRSDPLRGHADIRQAARPLRHPDAAPGAARAQRAGADRAGAGDDRAAAAAVALISDAGTPLLSRSGLSAGAGGAGGGAAGVCRARGVGAARGAGGRRAADRCVRLRRLPAAEGRRRGPMRSRRCRSARERWCSTSRRAGWGRRCARWRRISATTGRPRWRWS